MGNGRRGIEGTIGENQPYSDDSAVRDILARTVEILAVPQKSVAELLGWVADHHGLPAALAISALTPLAGFVAARFLPAPKDR